MGGCVRDALIGKNISDIDIATTLLPNQIIDIFTSNKIKTIATGLKHGTVTIILNKKFIEITTLRIDKYCDGRHADIEFINDWQLDASRRDFTINAMSIDQHGVIYDYYMGQAHLKLGKNQIYR